MTKDEKVRALLERMFAKIDTGKMLLEVAVREGVPFRHPDTGKWHDRSGLGFDTREGLEKYGDMFVYPDPQPEFKLR